MRTDDDWQGWGFLQLVEALRKWAERNSTSQDDRGVTSNFFDGNRSRLTRQEKVFQTKQHDFQPRPGADSD